MATGKFDQSEHEQHLHSARFRIYMVAWTAFFLVIIGMQFGSNLRRVATGPDQAAVLASARD